MRSRRAIPAALTVPLFALLATAIPSTPVAAAPGDDPVSGRIFVDVDRDGSIDPGELLEDTDDLFPPNGVTVTATDTTGNTVNGVVTSSAAGVMWSADMTSLVGHDARIEFALDPADLTAGWSETFRGDDSVASVVFASAGDTTVDFGVIPPSQCPTIGGGAESNLNHESGKLWTTCFVNGLRTEAGPQDVLVGLNFDRSGAVEHLGLKNGGNSFGNDADAQLGSVWGVAYDEWQSTLFTSAFLKRHSDLGAQGVDGLYWLSYPSGTWSSISLDSLGGPSFGADPTRDLAGVGAPNHDTDVYPLVGNRGIGDIDVTPDGKHLLVANIDEAAKALMVYDITGVAGGGDPVFRGSVGITNPGCPDASFNVDDYQIFAVTAVDGHNAVVGVHCTAENSAADPLTFPHPDLEAHLVAIDLSDPSTPTQGASVLDFPLSYERGCALTSSCNPNASFTPWDDTWSPIAASGNRIADTQAIVSDIDVLADGSLVLGLMDRFGHQGGWQNYQPDVTDTASYTTDSGGDILMVCNTSGDPNVPLYLMEGQAGCGDPANFPDTTGGAVFNAAFHGGPLLAGEWFGNDTFQLGTPSSHSETSQGGIYTSAWQGEVVMSAMDPINSVSGGLGWFDQDTGATVGRFELYRGELAGGLFGKAAGIGDVEGCFIPVGLGDLVWLDLDRDGVQDPGELPLVGATVTVTGGSLSGPVVVITDGDGRWQVTSADGITHGEAYTVTIDPTTITNLPPGIAVGELIPTVQDSVATTDTSDADLDAATSTITTAPLAVGEVNHSYDAGYAVEFDLALTKSVSSIDGPLFPDGSVTFTITVANQGDGPVEFIEVVDYVDTSMFEGFRPADNQTGGFAAVTGGSSVNAFVYRWDGADPTSPRAEIRPAALADAPVGNLAGVFSPDPRLWLYEGETIEISLTLRVADTLSSAVTQLENRAEISAWDVDAEPSNGSSTVPNADGSVLTDIDSTADADDGSNGGETTGGALVDDETGQSGIAGGDEDDHDPALVPLADLALIKTRSADQPLAIDPTAVPAPTVSFDITVKNQGSVSVFDVQVVDPTPAGLEFVSAGTIQTADGIVTVAPVVTDLGLAGGVSTFGIDRIDPGEQVIFDVVFRVIDPAATVFVNAAEISRMLDAPGGDLLQDLDSTPDVDLAGDPIDQTAGVNPEDDRNSHNDIDHDRDGAGAPVPTPGDEDDHDAEVVLGAPTHSLGNQVWFDENNDGLIGAGESGIVGVRVELFTDDDADGLPDDRNNDGVIDADDAVDSTTTTADGLYLFDGLAAGDYVIGVPPSQWDPDGPLFGRLSSDPTTADADSDIDGDDNASPGPHGYLWTGAATLGDTEPTGELPDNDLNTADTAENLTVDIGVYEPTFDLALLIQLDDGTNLAGVAPGEQVTFTITVVNQGVVDAADVQIVDYVPAGLTLADADWAVGADGAARFTLPGTLVAGASTTVDITFTVDADAPAAIDNWAEIAEATPTRGGVAVLMPNGALLPDVDSVADAANDDAFENDDDTTGDGAANADEDDHDRAQLTLVAGNTLAFTGTTSLVLAFAASLLFVFGFGLLVLTRRREQQPA